MALKDTPVKEIKLSEASHKLFVDFANDAGNWSGNPWTDGNIGMTKEERGNLTQLKRYGLIRTEKDGGDEFVIFTARGQEYAALHDGVDEILDDWIY